LMIDDTKENLDTADQLGIQTTLFRSSRQLQAELEAATVLPDQSCGAEGRDPVVERPRVYERGGVGRVTVQMRKVLPTSS
jgi:hypothetical protein